MRKLVARLCCCLILLAGGSTSFAQWKAHTILWRITGKGLQRPSYLYGTVHLTDKRLFQFGDSVYAAIRNTDGFANELDLNAVAAYYVNKALDDQSNDQRLSDVLDKKQLDKLKDSLVSKFRKNADDITVKDVIREREKWVSDYFNKGEMPTIVDAYLYTLAHNQGKWTGGIEDMEDQTSIDMGDVKTVVASGNATTTEEMIREYLDQDLDGINNIVNGYDVGYRDALLTRRNVKMARRMDSLSAIRPMFFAVGAAHLPGDSGVISMLRVRGFTVEPVFSDKKIFAKNYHYDPVPVQWTEMQDENNLYSISMPGTPAVVKLYGLLELKFLTDFSNMSGYCTMAFLSNTDASMDDSLYDVLAQRIFSKEDVARPRKVTNGDIPGVEYIDRKQSYMTRIQFYHYKGVLYVAWKYGGKREYLLTEDADRFFNSLKMTPPEHNAPGNYHFHDPAIGIEFDGPAHLTYNETMTRQNQSALPAWDIRFYTGQDISSGGYVILGIKQAKAGSHITSDSVVLGEIAAYFAEKYKSDNTWGYFNGYRSVMFDGKADGTYVRALEIARGNKVYAFTVVADKPIDSTALKTVFTSVKLLPFQRMDWNEQYGPGRTFSSLLPSAFHYDTSATDGAIYYGYDSVSATNYSIATDTFSKYFWTKSDTGYFNPKIRGYEAGGSDILSQSISRKNNDPICDLLMVKKHTRNFFRIRLLIHGDVMYYITTAGDSAVVCGRDAAQFYDSFKCYTPVAFDVHKNKAEALLHALAGSDSAARAEAYRTLAVVSFDKSFLPQLHKALLADYRPVDSTTDSMAVNHRLGSVIGDIGDKSTITFLRDNYGRLHSDELRYVSLATLARIRTTESYNTLAGLMVAHPPDMQDYLVLANLMEDSLKLLRTIYPTISTLIPDTTIGGLVVVFGKSLLDSGLLTSADMAKNEQKLIALAHNDEPIYLTRDEYGMGIHHLVLTLCGIGDEASFAALKPYLGAKNRFLKTWVALNMAKKGVVADSAVWDSLASWPTIRQTVYDSLKAYGKETVFPARYKTQRSFSEGAMYSSLDSWKSTDYNIDFISDTVAIYHDTLYRFFMYKVTFTSATDTNVFLGVIGAYGADESNMYPVSNVAGIYTNEHYDAEDRGTLLQAELEQLEKPSEE
jgi:uncharacterized protein YbaP (TraB family)